MGKREQNLARILGAREKPLLRVLKLAEILSSEYTDEILSVYKRLGGVQAHCIPHLGKWDMALGDLAIELDEEQHFNRYREVTLDSAAYSKLPKFPKSEYLSYCRMHEDAALRKAGHGGWWTNPSCEKQFGEASDRRTLDDKGAPRWKQRAFHDFAKDLTPLIVGLPVARVSIWDTVMIDEKPFQVKDILVEKTVDMGRTRESLLRLLHDRALL